MDTYTPQWVTVARLIIALERQMHVMVFPRTVPTAEGLVLCEILRHLFLWRVEGKRATVSRLSSALGISRATCRRRLEGLIAFGYVQRNGKCYVPSVKIDALHQRRVLARIAAIVKEANKELAKLTNLG
jgi:DNA-binding IclR family transcriptional regulator